MMGLSPKGPYESVGRGRLFGVYTAFVTSVKKAHEHGRVEIELPWVAAEDARDARAWARLSTLMAGSGRGTWFVPEEGDEVLISFIAGDPRHPVVVGAMWNGKDEPPEKMDAAGKNHVRAIHSESGHVLTFDDTPGKQKVVIDTQGGHTVTLDDSKGGTITIAHNNKAKVEIDKTGKITIQANTQVAVKAPAKMQIDAGMLKVNAPTSIFSGVVKCEAVITNAIKSSVYTTGAGNVW